MSLDVKGFSEIIQGGVVQIDIPHNHQLLELGRNLPWESMLERILPDLKRTEKRFWWLGRPLRVRIHLGAYLLQQMFNLTDRATEQQLQDNAAVRFFCGYGIISKWRAPDHTKIAAFRSRLSAETQRALANLIAQCATDLGYANPAALDIDSTVQEANISYPALANLLIKVAIKGSVVAKGLNDLCHQGVERYRVRLRSLKQKALYYFNLKRKEASSEALKAALQHLWQETYQALLPVLNHMHHLSESLKKGQHAPIRRAVECLRWRGAQLLENTYGYLFEGIANTSISSLHAYAVGTFNKGKLNKGLQFGRAFQLGRIGGNFLFVGECSSLHMPDAPSLPAMLRLHQRLFGQGTLQSIATDKGYYSKSNEALLIKTGVKDIYLPRPERALNAKAETTPWPIRQALHDRRSGIEPLIGHTKHGGQMGRSRMRSDETTKSAGYAAVLGFNLRQLTRYVMGEVRPKIGETLENVSNNGSIGAKTVIPEPLG